MDDKAILYWHDAFAERVSAGADMRAEAEAMMVAAHAAQLMAIGPGALAVQLAATSQNAEKLAAVQSAEADRAIKH